MTTSIVTLIPAATNVHSIALVVRRSESQVMYFIFATPKIHPKKFMKPII